MKCIKCKNEMALDDTDYNFKGNYDDYYLCYVCGMSCILSTRKNKKEKIEWNGEE